MSRDNFSVLTKAGLALAAGYRCVRPGCARTTHFYDPAGQRMVHIGAASHDSAAAENGPRFDPELSHEQRKAYENGAWLCMSCARLVDVIPDQFPIGTLAQWQAAAHARIASSAYSSVPFHQINYGDACMRAKLFCDRVQNIRIDGHGVGISLPYKTRTLIEELWRDCYPLAPFNPLSTLYAHTVNRQKRILDALNAIVSEVSGNGDAWWYDENWRCYRLYVSFGMTPEQRFAVEYSGEKVNKLRDDFMEACQVLRDFSLGMPLTEILDLW